MNTIELSFAPELTIQKIWNKSYDESKYLLNYKKVKYDDQSYTIVHYNKKALTSENIVELRNIRSLIFDDDGNLLCISPPKSLDLVTFRKMYRDNKIQLKPRSFYQTDLYIEPLIEGTMINVFYDNRNEKWVCATKGNVGASHSFFRVGEKGKTFLEMFQECAYNSNLDINMLPTEYCYSFVIQHMENRLVSKFDNNNLILVKTYRVTRDDDGDTRVFMLDTCGAGVVGDERDILRADQVDISPVSPTDIVGRMSFTTNESTADTKEVELNTIKLLYDARGLHTSVFVHPEYGVSIDVQKYLTSTISTRAHLNSTDGFWMSHIGINFVSRTTGDRLRYRSNEFQYIRMLRGNQPKLECHYFDLRKQNRVGVFLSYYPEHTQEFDDYQVKLHNFTDTLYKNYVDCYIKKTKPLGGYPKEYRTHMFNIHVEYKRIKEDGEYIRMKNVIEYVNLLESHIIMYSLNFNKRPTHTQVHKTKNNIVDVETTTEIELSA